MCLDESMETKAQPWPNGFSRFVRRSKMKPFTQLGQLHCTPRPSIGLEYERYYIATTALTLTPTTLGSSSHRNIIVTAKALK